MNVIEQAGSRMNSLAAHCLGSTPDEVCLKESDIPGASLGGRDPVTLKIPQLKRWLQCRKASTKGNKSDLVAR
jgi:hypothetical protein